MSTSRVLAKYAELDARADRMLGPAEADRPAPAPARSDAVPTYVHEQCLALIDELFSLVDDGSGAGMLSPMLRSLRAMRGRLLRDFAQVPPEQITAFLHELGAKMLNVGSVDAARAELPQAAGE